MKKVEKDEARRLRREEGLGIRDIATKLGVAKSSVSLWVRDIVLSPEQSERLKMRCPIFNRKMSYGGNIGIYKKWLERRIQYQGAGATLAKAYGLDPTFMSGCMLYWAEGHKSKNCLTISNSDVDLLKFFVTFLKTYFGVPASHFTVRVHHYTNAISTDVKHKYWTEQLGLPLSAVRKGQVDNYSKASKRLKDSLPYGTCHVSILHGQSVLQAIYGALQYFVGFKKDAWLGVNKQWS